jgi:putative CocE/NonD family hydrolase
MGMLRSFIQRLSLIHALVLTWAFADVSGCALWPQTSPDSTDALTHDQSLGQYIRANYQKRECQIPMRDGVTLFTAVYVPKDASRAYPIMLFRTPYSVGPYGADAYKDMLGPSAAFAREGFIFAYQDVRGKYLSEGEFVNMRPHIDRKSSPTDIDESSDTFDTIEWLLANVPNHNGRVGMWGISYPGFYCAAGMIDAHPALKAVSPQAPIADWYFDDFHHHGAFFLPHNFNFMAGFGRPRPTPSTEGWARFDHGTPDGYQFFLDMGPLKNADLKYFKGDVAFWNEVMAHPDYDEFWQSRNILPHLNNVAPAVMTVGGWFDAEDLYGPLKIYREIEQRNPSTFNVLVMGPWVHGGWARTDGDRLGNISFGDQQSLFYREQIELPFFKFFLKDEDSLDLPEACVFETGENQWRRFDTWPPSPADGCEGASLYLSAHGALTIDEAPMESSDAFDEFISDPAKPIPFTEAITTSMTKEYMTDDQRFAARRPDVLMYQTDVLENDVTLAGPIQAELWVSTSAEDADWIVKVIDVLPPDAKEPEGFIVMRPLGGYQMMVRSEVIRGRYRNSYEQPEPFVPGEATLVDLELQDVLHTFKRGHRIMVQIQSTWFPLVDRNPQKWVDNIFEADDADFIKATHRVYRSAEHPTRLRVSVLRP